MKRLRGCLGVFLIFFFGVLFGIGIAMAGIHEKVREVVEGGPDKVVDVIVERLNKDLHLDSGQQEMLHQIAIDTRIKLASIRQQTQPQVAQTLNDATTKVRGILTPSQTKKFDEIIGKARKRWKLEEAVLLPAPAEAAKEPPAPAAEAAPAPPPPANAEPAANR